MTPEFSPLDYVRQLEAAGVSTAQAEVHAGALAHALVDVALSRDLVRVEVNVRQELQHIEERLNLRIDLVKTELTARIDLVKAELMARIDLFKAELMARMNQVDAKVDQVETRLGARIDKLETRMANLEHEMAIHRWLLGLVLATCLGQLAMLFKLLAA